MNPSSIPIDLILLILSRLPAKSVARFRCVSKLWASSIGSSYFTELFLTMSSAKPRLLFAIAEDGVWSFFSLPQIQNPCEKSSSPLVLAAEFHVKLSQDNERIYPYNDLRHFSCAYASGLIYLYGHIQGGRHLICDPNIGRYTILEHDYIRKYSFFGFEPIRKQYKVLLMRHPLLGGPPRLRHLKLFTLRTGYMSCRQTKRSLPHYIENDGICIDGVLYYLGGKPFSEYEIVCFDLRSEKFTFIDVEMFGRLINYKGKVAVIFWRTINNELCVWVLEDVKKQEWSKYAYTWSDDDKFFCPRHVSVAGATPWGEIVFSMREYTSTKPFYVFYFNPEKSSFRRVEIKGFGETFGKRRSVCTFVNHVEDLTVSDLIKTSHVCAQDTERIRKKEKKIETIDHWS